MYRSLCEFHNIGAFVNITGCEYSLVGYFSLVKDNSRCWQLSKQHCNSTDQLSVEQISTFCTGALRNEKVGVLLDHNARTDNMQE